MNGEARSREEKLIEDFKRGSRERFDELVQAYTQKLYRFAYGLLGNHHDAEEVVQDAFVRAYHALDHFRGDSSFETWMHRITMNLARNKFHWNRRRGEGLTVSLSEASGTPDGSEPPGELELPDSSYSPDLLLEKVETRNNVLKGIEAMPRTLREAMLLRHVQDMPYEQIAAVLECKIGTVKSRIARGRELLRTYLLNLDESAGKRTGAGNHAEQTQ